MTVAFGCACGAVRGSLDPERPIHRLVCYCEDCRAFALACGNGAVLDASGGTDFYQVTAGRVRLATGRNALGAVRVTSRGPVRWHCRECGSALANTLPRPTFPFTTLVTATVEGGMALAPIQGAVFSGSAADAPLHPPVSMARVMARFAHRMVVARWRGEHRMSAFHEDGRTIVEPRAMDETERAALLSEWPPTPSPPQPSARSRSGAGTP